MFDYTKMIQRAIEFFPLWTDIRKRYKTSYGGKLLSSVIDEEITIEETIQEYIDSYFLYNYIGHEDEVMAFCYTANVGDLKALEGASVYYNDTLFPFSNSIKHFEENLTFSFYEEGKIYIRVEDYIEGVNTFKLVIDDQSAEYNLEKVHIWNIFDEFATFVNTRRYQNETNKQLVDRILYITKNMPNGTEDGLKHSIISELMTDFPELTMDDIIIERPTANNLMKPYESYETLLDLLAEVNRDVYRCKRWDLDYWEYDFESISYIPHVWDKVVRDWQNGVGSYNDLEVILTDNNETTDATIHFYEKTLEDFQKYVYNKNIDNEIHFTMSRYNNILNKKNIKYKIQASELEEITYEDIKMNLYEAKKQTDEIAIQDIASGWGKDIERIDNSIIDDINNYKLEFESKSGYDLKISRANVIYINKTTGVEHSAMDLLENPPAGFVRNSEYEVVSESTKMIIETVEQFNQSSGFCNENEHITIAPGENSGYGKISLTDMAGLYINYEFDCDTVSIPNDMINTMGGYWTLNNKQEVFVVRGDYSTEEKIIDFSMEVNELSFDIHETTLNSRILITVIDDGVRLPEQDISDKSTFSIEKTSQPRMVQIIIKVLSINDVVFTNFRYNTYSIELKLAKGELEKTSNGYKLPNFYSNELEVTLHAGSGYSPVLKGIYIGESFKNIKYVTDKIPYIDNCYRIFEITTNGITNLLTVDDNGKEISRKNNYEALFLYKAKSDQAYVRIDLSEYESIEKIDTQIGSLETIEESGIIYYNIRLKTGQIASKIIVKGTKNRVAREVTLEDLIKFYISDFDMTYDSIYCSKCTKGLIVSRLNPGGTPYNVMVNVKSEVFKGLKIVKYEMKMPQKFGAIFGSNNGYENRSNVNLSSFDYISIYPAGSQLYVAINEFDTYLMENRFIPIANNFSPMLNREKLLFYNVELYDKSQAENITVRFHNMNNAQNNIFDLPSWSIGTNNSFIAIYNNIDLLNNAMYDITTFNIDEKGFLSSSVDIKESYELTDHTILNTEKFIIDTESDLVTIKYDYYDGTSKKEHLLKYEEIMVENDGFNKLTFSNIDSVFHCSTLSPDNGHMINIEFEILKEQGIIIWKNPDLLKNGVRVYIVYSIKKPVAFVFDLEYLYRAIDYDVEAYNQIGEYDFTAIKNGQQFDLLDKSWMPEVVEDYKASDLIYVSCTSPTFESKLKNNIITFERYLTEETILIKTGYYYINGREYYLFSEDDSELIKNNEYYTSNNIDISGGEITTYKETNNYITNSEMRLKGLADLYYFDCTKPLTYGISKFDYLTACNTFDSWETFEMKMKLATGLNGLAIEFVPQMPDGYAYIDITDALIENVDTYVSFYATKYLEVFIGKEDKYLDIKFERSLSIKMHSELIYENSDIRYTIINKKKDERFYLIVKGAGIIDDIIISDSKQSTFEAHNKNIDMLGFDLYEKKPEGSQYKMVLRTDKDYTSNHAALMSDGCIKTTSSLDWYITEYKSYTDDNAFKTCILQNVGVNRHCIFTGNNDGVLETLPIQIDNLDCIKKLIIKINDLDVDNMKGFETLVYSSNAYNGTFEQCCNTQTKNRFCISKNSLDRFIKLKINIPAYKYIKSIHIFAEYISTNEKPLPVLTKQTGFITSKIYDLQDIVNCRVKSIDIKDISNINDIEIYIRASKDHEFLDVWTDWRRIKFDNNFKITSNIDFNNARFLQYKVLVKTRNSFVNFKGITIEIK